jgi:nucleoside phosphorylase
LAPEEASGSVNVVREDAMPVDMNWVKQNLNITNVAHAGDDGVGEEPKSSEQTTREIIDFDSEAGGGEDLATLGLSRFTPIDWPEGLGPIAGSRPTTKSLPKADVLIVTWTVDEGHALSQVMTPGIDSKDDWVPYEENFATISQDLEHGCPALDAHPPRLGTFWTCTINGKKVTLFKSDSHMSTDGPKLPVANVWKQIIEDCKPSLVITTGTAGGIGPEVEVGDVVISRFLSFYCWSKFLDLNGLSYECPIATPTTHLATAEKLFAANAQRLPSTNGRAPKIITAASQAEGVVTTGSFDFDTTVPSAHPLHGKGDACEMGDAVLGSVCKELGADAPNYVSVRNVSDPQISSDVPNPVAVAVEIYKRYGIWSSICSAIVCWAIIAGM